MKMWHMLYDQLLTILSPKGLRTIGREIFTEVLHVLGEKFSIFFWNGGDLLYFKGYLIVCYPTPFCWGGGRLNLLLNFQKGGLFRGSFLRGGGVKLPPSPRLKLVTIMIKTWNLVRKYTHTYVVSENITFSTKALFISFCEKSAFFGK